MAGLVCAAVFVAHAAPVFAQRNPHECAPIAVPPPPGPECQPGHNTLGDSRYAYTEDIAFGMPIVLNGPTSDWTVIAAGCPALSGKNVRSTVDFHALLRLYLRISAATAAPGARYEVQLLLDGNPWTWTSRRVRGTYPDSDSFETLATAVPAGQHAYSVRARLIDPGSMTLDAVWINAQGTPATNPTAEAVDLDVLTVGTTWTRVTTALTLDGGASLDVYTNGAFQVLSQAGASTLELEFRVDGQAFRRSSLAVPLIVPDSVRAIDHLLTVQPGHHTVELYARATGGSAVLQYRVLGYISFPTHTAVREAMARDTVHVTLTPEGPQPGAASGLNPDCGRWTKLLELEMPETRYRPQSTISDVVQTLDGYVELLNNTGSTHAEIAFEFAVTEPSVAGTDLGWVTFQIPPTPSGLYHFGDSLKVVGSAPAGSKVLVWIRKVNGCGYQASGSFDVGRRYMSIKYLPADACHYF